MSCKIWSVKEVNELIENFKKGLTIEQIAELHDRTIISIYFKRRNLLSQLYYNKTFNENDILSIFNISYDTLIYYINRDKPPPSDYSDINFSNKGKLWSGDEDILLIENLKRNLPLYKISEIHQRTIKGIDARILYLACKLHINGISKARIISKLKINEDDYTLSILKYKENMLVDKESLVNHGKRWEKHEEISLIDNIYEKKTLYELSNEMHRSPRAIILKLKSILSKIEDDRHKIIGFLFENKI